MVHRGGLRDSQFEGKRQAGYLFDAALPWVI
jgi:hypothetical protein